MAASAPPQLPPRTYPRSPLALYSAPAVTRPVPAYERYRVLLAFFRRLSFLLTLTGSGTAVLVYIWRKYFLPKWTDTNAARSKISAHQSEAYEALLPKLNEAARRGGGLALKVESPPPAEAAGEDEETEEAGKGQRRIEAPPPPPQPAQDEDEEEILDLSAPIAPSSSERKQIEGPKDTASEAGSSSSTSRSPQGSQDAPRSQRPTPLDLASLDKVDEYAKKPVQMANKNALPASSKAASALLTSLSGFNADINTQAFLTGSERMRPAFSLGSSSSSSSSKSGSDVAQLKAEIRSLKGVLLSRRNFGYARSSTPVHS